MPTLHDSRRILAALSLGLALPLAVLGACTTAEPPTREPAVEEEAPPAPAAAEVEDPAEAEIEAERRAEEAIERVPVAEALPHEQEDSVLEVFFEAGTAILTDEAREALDLMYERLIAEASDFYLEVQGHTDPTGSEAANQRLAEERAEVVRSYLHREKGVPLERMGITPLGSTVPVAHNHTPDGRQQNRRVVVVVLLPP